MFSLPSDTQCSASTHILSQHEQQKYSGTHSVLTLHSAHTLAFHVFTIGLPLRFHITIVRPHPPLLLPFHTPNQNLPCLQKDLRHCYHHPHPLTILQDNRKVDCLQLQDGKVKVTKK